VGGDEEGGVHVPPLHVHGRPRLQQHFHHLRGFYLSESV
jgi:hypothetical protein